MSRFRIRLKMVSKWRFLYICYCALQGKEKNPSKNSMQTSPAPPTDSATAASLKLPPTLSAMATVATTASKSSGGKFTTANFIETTIQPSPANFGVVEGTATTVVTSSASATAVAMSTAAATSEPLARSPTSGNNNNSNNNKYYYYFSVSVTIQRFNWVLIYGTFVFWQQRTRTVLIVYSNKSIEIWHPAFKYYHVTWWHPLGLYLCTYQLAYFLNSKFS